MKKITALPAAVLFSAAVLFGTAAGSASATPIQYSFYGTHVFEQNADNTPVTNYLFASGALLFGHFSFEPDTAAVLANAADPGALSSYGLYSVYFGAIRQLTGSVGGYTFFAASGSTLVANSNIGASTPNDGVFNIAGNLNGDEVGTGFTGFSIGDFTLKSFNLFSVGGQDYLVDQSLPTGLSKGPANTGINLIFEDAQHRERTVMFWGAQILPTPVPVPAAGWLFGGALAGLIEAKRRKALL